MDPAVGASVLWNEQAVHLKDVSAKHPVPNVVKVIKGQYRNIGASKSVHSELYLHSVQVTSKVLAEAVKLKEGKAKMNISEQKYSLPMSYKGWFELLSQDGKSVKAIQSVQELARFFPPTCLVRDNIKAFVGNGGSEMSLDRTRTVAAGEVLTLVAEMFVPLSMGKSMGKRRVLKCTDSKGNAVFFGLEQKGIFSPIAGQTNISGVHSIKGLMDKFRLPLLVRLVHGVIPSKMERGFNGIFRLVSVYSDENAFVCPLKKDSKMVPISTREPLKVVTAQDYKNILKREDVRVIQKRCVDMLESYMNSIHILISMPDASMLKGKEDIKPKNNAIVNEPIPDPACPKDSPAVPSISKDEEDLLFQEIDGIYQYVREGGLPPQPKPQHGRVHSNNMSPTGKKYGQKSPLTPKSSAGLQDCSPEKDDDPLMEIKMKQLDLLDDDDDDNGTTLRRQDGYNWEEPIYEPIEKIREQKKKFDVKKGHDGSSPPVLLSGFDTPPDSLFKDDFAKILDDPSKSLVRQSLTNLGDTGLPVDNLRQVMRSNSCAPENLRSVSLTAKDQAGKGKDVKTTPPPLPPKRYSSSPGDFPPKGQHVKSRHKQSALPLNNRKSLSPPLHVVQSPVSSSHQISSSSSFTHQPESKMYTSSASLAPTHPPYIAVARVPGYQHDPAKASVLANPDIYAKQNNVHNGHKLHSMYL